MNVRSYGVDKSDKIVTLKIHTNELNIDAFIETLEANKDQHLQEEWLERYLEISNIYLILFREGKLPDELIDNTDFVILEMAQEAISEDLEYLMDQPKDYQGDYYYEFARSIGVEIQASELPEKLDEESDFF